MTNLVETADVEPRHVPHPGMGFREFVGFVAALMAINALAIDAMLPALPQIGDALGVVEENQRQLVITSYLLGFGVAQLFYGPLSDRFGRRPVLLFGLLVYVVASGLSAFSTSLDQMLVARVLQGVGSAATRVLAVSIVRDCYSGRHMARVMSFAFIVFIAVPVIAPSVGQAIVLVAPWEWIFLVLGLFGLTVALWSLARLPETLPPERRTPISVASVLGAFRIVATNRAALGYTLASAAILGALFGFINSAQQIFVEVFGTGAAFPLIFAGIALFIAVSSLVNARIVERVGMRRVSHTAMFGFTGFAALHAAIAWSGHESLAVFVVLQAAMMFCFGLIMSNFSSMAMDPVGRVAGTAASFQGFVTTVIGALLGFYIGQHYDGTAVPLTLGYAGLGALSIAIVLVTERGRLFEPVNAAPRP
jgi:DHA1 family bicyclomycin/chloramphenicol resistance-like MFS transporter